MSTTNTATNTSAVAAGLIEKAAGEIPETPQRFSPGDRVRLIPTAGTGRRWWTVRAVDDRYLVATCPRPFGRQGELLYTVIDFTGWTSTYNGIPPGVVRSSVDALGGGYDVGHAGENCRQLLAELRNSTCQLSRRRLISVSQIQHKRARCRTPLEARR